MLQVGDTAPDFCLPTDTQGDIKLSDFLGKQVVIFFYPKDLTSGCTKEAISFSESEKSFAGANTVVIGISADSLTRHEQFRKKHTLTIVLASDEERGVIEEYGVWVEKNMYGRKYMGIERASFLIDNKGIISQIWHKVRLAGHVEKVHEAAQTLNS